jgi:hypothetical protein
LTQRTPGTITCAALFLKRVSSVLLRCDCFFVFSSARANQCKILN